MGDYFIIHTTLEEKQVEKMIVKAIRKELRCVVEEATKKAVTQEAIKELLSNNKEELIEAFKSEVSKTLEKFSIKDLTSFGREIGVEFQKK